MDRKIPWTALTAAAAGAATLATVDLALRPWYLNWGATDEEIAKTWPGDELCPDAASVATRAITIHAPAGEVWPWIVQIGQDRGGFYSYSWLENLFGARIHNADNILPDCQTLEVGDAVRMTPRERYGGRGFVRVARIEPGRALVLVSPEDFIPAVRNDRAPGGVWTFVLEPVDERNTRFIVRSRSGAKPGAGRFLVFDPAHFVMERKMMLGIRDRAEAKVS
jgi:hypothetical protein